MIYGIWINEWTVNCSLPRTNHTDLLTKKLSSICYLIRNIKSYLSISALKMIYHSLFHSIMSYGIRFWGNSPHNPVIFKMQKRVIRILMGIGYRESCRGLFKELKILTLSSQYFFSWLLFVVHNRGYFAPNSIYHNFNTRQKNNLHLPHVSLTMYQKGVFYSGINVFNALPLTIKEISSNPTKFKSSPKALSAKTFILQFRWIFLQEEYLTYAMFITYYIV